MLGLALLGAGAVGILGFAWWVRRRWRDVDSYYEREYQDPPIVDFGGWFGGGGSL